MGPHLIKIVNLFYIKSFLRGALGLRKLPGGKYSLVGSTSTRGAGGGGGRGAGGGATYKRI